MKTLFPSYEREARIAELGGIIGILFGASESLDNFDWSLRAVLNACNFAGELSNLEVIREILAHMNGQVSLLGML